MNLDMLFFIAFHFDMKRKSKTFLGYNSDDEGGEAGLQSVSLNWQLFFEVTLCHF